MASCIHVPLSGLAIKMTSLPDPVASTGQILLAPASEQVWSLKLSPPIIGERGCWAPFCHDPFIYFQGEKMLLVTSDLLLPSPRCTVSWRNCQPQSWEFPWPSWRNPLRWRKNQLRHSHHWLSSLSSPYKSLSQAVKKKCWSIVFSC